MNLKSTTIHPYESEQAGNAYLMSIVAVIAGLPLPIINVIASLIFYLAKRRATYYVRWHSLQALIAQAIVMPFNSIALGWTISIFTRPFVENELYNGNHHYRFEESLFELPSAWYWAYLSFVLLLNLMEFIGVLVTASEVRKGKNVRWFLVANVTDALCSKENRDPYVI